MRWLLSDGPIWTGGIRREATASASPPPAPTVTIPVPGGNVLSTTASVTAAGEVTITNQDSVLSSDLGVTHYLVRADNMMGKTLVARRPNNDPTVTNGADLAQWQMAWSYDVDDGWSAFDSYANVSPHVVASNTAPLTQNTVYIARRPVFLNSRWDAAIARWRASPLTGPTASGNAQFVVGTLPVNTYAPSMPLHGFKFGTGPAAVVITGLIHTGEHIGAFAMEALVDWLLGADPDAAYLRSKCTFYVYPNINPQANYAGASRVELYTFASSNTIWLDSGHDDKPLSLILRNVWVADLPAVVDGNIDFHDGARTAGYAMTYDRVAGSGNIVGALQAEYYTRTGILIDRNPGGTTSGVVGGVARYIRDKYQTTWMVTAEHWVAADHGVPQWQQWGRDFGRAMRDHYDTDGTGKWKSPVWAPWGAETTVTVGTDAQHVAATDATTTANPGLSMQIPDGKSIEVVIELTNMTNTKTVQVRHSPSADLTLTGGATLHSRGSNSTPYYRIQTIPWDAARPYFGIICPKNTSTSACSFRLTNMVKYRVLP